MSGDRIQPEPPDPPRITRRPRQAAEDLDAGDKGTDLPKLGSLAQTARHKHLRQARNTLLVVGILMAIIQCGMGVFEFLQLKDQADPVVLAVVVLIHGCLIAVFLVFIVLAFFVEKYPVPITAVALSLFIGLQLISAVADPMNLARGWILKIIVIVALVKALQAGLAAKKEEREAQREAEFDT